MANLSEIKLKIATELDAAGIKATSEQIDQLAKGARKAGSAASSAGEKFGGFEKALGKLPGKVGEIASQFTGLAGKVTMVAGAFTTGVEIGNKICDVARKWGLMSDPVDDLRKATKNYEQELQAVKDSLQEVVAAEMKRFDAASSSADAAIKKIDDQTAAYLRQATALKGLREAGDNAEMMQLERDKFEEMKAYSDAGYAEAAEQIGRYYDVLKSELQAKQQIEAFDRESVAHSRELEQSEAAYAKAAQRAYEAKRQQEDAEDALEEHRRAKSIGGDSSLYFDSEDAAKDDALEKVAERAAKDAARAEEVARKKAEKLETVEADELTRQMQRANLDASGRLSIDRAAQAYDEYVTATGNPLNADIDGDWAKELLEKTVEADDTQRQILESVKDFANKLDTLLQAK